MTDWRVILQLETNTSTSCRRYSTAGVVAPARICVVACDTAAEPHAIAVHDRIERWLRQLGGPNTYCGPARGMGCQAWQEASCQHVRVLVIGSASLDPAHERTARDWITHSAGRAVVITALVPPLTHKRVFGGGTYPVLEKCTAAAWGGSADQLVSSALSAALLDEKPGVFISYLRKEASAAADDIHRGLAESGYRVFLDRFNGTPGRLFPHELAEAMASMGLVVLLETSGLSASRWTMWEVAFARRFRLGPVAVNFAGAPIVVGAVHRRFLMADAAMPLTTSTVDDIVGFIRDHIVIAAVGRRAYFETLVRAAAQSKGGDVVDAGAGVLSLEKPGGHPVGCALPAAVPGRLRHVSRLVQARSTGPYILGGEHQHLPPGDRADLRWLAGRMHLSLAGSASIYHAVRRVL